MPTLPEAPPLPSTAKAQIRGLQTHRCIAKGDGCKHCESSTGSWKCGPSVSKHHQHRRIIETLASVTGSIRLPPEAGKSVIRPSLYLQEQLSAETQVTACSSESKEKQSSASHRPHSYTGERNRKSQSIYKRCKIQTGHTVPATRRNTAVAAGCFQDCRLSALTFTELHITPLQNKPSSTSHIGRI